MLAATGTAFFLYEYDSATLVKVSFKTCCIHVWTDLQILYWK